MSLEIQNISKKSSRKDVVRNLLFLAITILVAYLLVSLIGIEDLRNKAGQMGIWGPVVIVVAKMMTIIVVPLGGAPIYATAGALFGFKIGFLITFIGDVLGFSSAFLLSRLFGRKIVNFFVPANYLPTVEQIMNRVGESKIFIKARVAFIGLPEVFAYAAGLTSVSFFVFIALQMLLHIPSSLLMVLFGEALFAGNTLYFLSASGIALLAALFGGYFLQKDLSKVA